MSRKGRDRARVAGGAGQPARAQRAPDRRGDGSPQMSAEALAREKRRSRFAGTAGALAILSLFASQTAGRTLRSDELLDFSGAADLAQRFLQFDAARGAVFATGAFTALAYLLLIPFGLFLWHSCRSRRDHLSPWLRRLTIAALGWGAAVTIVAFFALSGIVDNFLALPAQTDAAAEFLRNGSGLFRFATPAALLAPLIIGLWAAWIAYELMRTGLSTRTVGVVGIAAGVVPIISPEVGTAALIGWSGSVAIILFGYWPGGRPPAWDEGRALETDA